MRSKSPRAVWGLGAGRVKRCSSAGEGASFQKPCSRLRQSMFFTSYVCQRFFKGAAAAAAGRGSPPPPGAGVGQTVAIPFHEHGVRGTRWYKARGAGGLGRAQFPAPAPPGAAFAIPLERNGASGGWGPDVRNGALVQARAHLLKNHALACTRARFPHLMRSKSPRAVWGLGAGRAKWCSGAGEGASFQKSCSRLHQSVFFYISCLSTLF